MRIPLILFFTVLTVSIISDIIIYKDLAARIVQTSYYKGWRGFGFRHFVKAISLFIKGAILNN